MGWTFYRSAKKTQSSFLFPYSFTFLVFFIFTILFFNLFFVFFRTSHSDGGFPRTLGTGIDALP